MRSQPVTEHKPEPNPPPPAFEVIEGGAPPADTLPDAPPPTREDNASRIHWDATERRAVVLDLARLIRKQGWRHIPDTRDRTGRNFLADFLATAQLVLPRERRRLSASPTQLGEAFWTLVQGALTTGADLEAKNSNGTSDHATETTTALFAGPATVAPAPATAAPAGPPEGKVQLDAADPLRSVPLDALLHATFTRLHRNVQQSAAKVSELEQLTVMQAEDNNRLMKADIALNQRLAALEARLALVNTTTEKLPRVAIVGCRLYEFEHIRQGAEAAGLKLDLRHYDQEANPTKISADWAILMKWGRHAWQDQINAAITNTDRRIFLNGGVGMVITQLKTWFQSA